jgi:hypothetical protein
MDDASFGLSERSRVFHLAGIRHVLPPDAACGPDILAKEPWPALLAKLPPSPKTIWTYPDLGQDLTGQASRERSGLWRRLIPALELPKGFVGFLPHCLPGDAAVADCSDHFLLAVSRLSPAVVVIFDENPGNALLAASRKQGGDAAQPIVFHVASSPETLLGLSDEAFAAAAKLLADVLLS